jgi:hypothetical protein
MAAVSRVGVYALLVLAMFFACASVSFAATIYVDSDTGNDTTGDGTSGAPYKTFHKGYTEASAGDTLDIDGTFSWTDADETGDASTSGYTISKNLTISGSGPDTTIVQANTASSTATSRVFTIGSSATVTVENLTLRNGKVTGTTTHGGCLSSTGTTTLIALEVHDCSAGGYGGGISNQGTLSLRDSTIYNNTTYYAGGGVSQTYSATGNITLTNNTLYGNLVTAAGGAFYGGGFYANTGDVYLTNNTIVSNVVTNGIGGGAHLHFSVGDAYLHNNLIANNTAYYTGTRDWHAYGGTIYSGHNIIGRSESYSWQTTGDWTDSNSDGTFVQYSSGLTGTLGLDSAAAINDNPQETKTWAIVASTSIAIDTGTTTDNGTVAIPNDDQRGFTREGAPDIGAYEYGAVGGGGDDSSEDSSGGGPPKRLAVPPAPSLSVDARDKLRATVSGVYRGHNIKTEDVGFRYWSEDEDEESVLYDGGVNSFRYRIRDLACSTTYYVEGFAENSMAETVTETIEFTTDACPPEEKEESDEAAETPAKETDSKDDKNAEEEQNENDTSMMDALRAQVSQLQQRLAALVLQSNVSVGREARAEEESAGVPEQDLTLGDSGEAVVWLQEFLIAENTGPSARELARVGASGYFGTYTKNALGEYQVAHGIQPHAGYYGSITRAYLVSLGS